MPARKIHKIKSKKPEIFFRAGGSNSNTQWAKIKKWVLVEGRTGSTFIAELIEMNLLHILNLELTKLK